MRITKLVACPFCERPFKGPAGMWAHLHQAHHDKLKILRVKARPWDDEKAELLERIRYLETTMYRRDWEVPREFGLTRQEGQFLACLLAKSGFRSHDFILDAINRGNTFSDSRLSQVIACKVRRKLKPWGISIERNWGLGYGLTEPDRHRLLNWNTEPKTQVAA